MDFKITFNIPEFKNQIELGDRITLIGSCFSDEMEQEFSNSGFKTLSNPFGTLFHPLAIANEIEQTLLESNAVNVLQRDDVYLTWSAGSVVHAYSKECLIDLVVKRRKKLLEFLLNEGVLIVTFGTAWGYTHQDLNLVVGNCHKEPGSVFAKQLTQKDELLNAWGPLIQKIKNINPDLKIVFTVSPVRHLKDGVIENSRSKARLIEFVHDLVSNSGAEYFPAYEIVLDELRDYRFFKSDHTHPTKETVRYVWSKFMKAAFSNDSLEVIQRVVKANTARSHRPLHVDSIEEKTRLQKLNEEIESLKQRYPQIYIQ